MADGDAYVRSVRGTRARWYREAVADPQVTIHAGGASLRATAEAASDPDSIARVSAALVKKYTGIDGLEPMLQPDILDTTLKITPA